MSYAKVDGGAGSGAGSGEAALDIEMLAGLAPQASIDVYQSPNTNTGFYDIFKKFAVSDTNRVLSVSWGSCEANTVLASVKAQESVFEQANAQGQTIFAAAGDEGSTSCFRPSTGKTNPKVSALTPASAPFVVGVGGTSFRGTGASQQEIVWNDSNSALGVGAGGGGVSSIWCMPGYQHQTRIPGIINAHSRRDAKSCASKHFRQVPDVAADGDPLYGYAVYYDGGWLLGGVGGTSAATPVWASIAALTQASPFCAAYGSRAPTLPQNLYAAVAARHSYVYAKTPQVVRDITFGNNDYTPSGYTGGLYRSARGYDMASGLGAPMVSGESHRRWFVFLAGLTQVLCHQSATRLKTVKVTSVSPKFRRRPQEDQGHGARGRVPAHRIRRRGPDHVRVQGPGHGRRLLHQDRLQGHPARREGRDGRHQDLRRFPVARAPGLRGTASPTSPARPVGVRRPGPGRRARRAPGPGCPAPSRPGSASRPPRSA